MSQVSHIAQNRKQMIPLVIKSGQQYSYPLRIEELFGLGARGLQLIIDDLGWDAADLTVQFSDNAYVEVTGSTEAKKLGTYSDAGQSVAAKWYPLQQKDGTLIRLTALPTGGSGASPSVRPLHSEFWVTGTWKYMRLVSTNTASTAAVNQTGDRTFNVKPLL